LSLPSQGVLAGVPFVDEIFKHLGCKSVNLSLLASFHHPLGCTPAIGRPDDAACRLPDLLGTLVACPRELRADPLPPPPRAQGRVAPR